MEISNSMMNHPNQDHTIEVYPTRIVVLGTGGAGNNTINNLTKRHLENVVTLAVNTDAQDLLKTTCSRKLLIGKNISYGLGAGGDPEIGERAAEESREIIEAALEHTDLLFVTCGLGGGTGTGSAPIIAKIARAKGILTNAIVSMPFSEEGIIRWENAQIGLERLKKEVDTLILLKNDRLVELYPHLSIEDAFRESDQILIGALSGLSNLIIKPGLVNLDFADVSMVLKDGPNIMIGIGESNTDNRVEDAIRRAIGHPLMMEDITGAQSVLVHMTGGPDVTMKEAHAAIKLISGKLDTNARVIWGITIDKILGNTFRIMLIMGGIPDESMRKKTVSEGAEAQTAESLSDAATEVLKDHAIKDKKALFDIKESILTKGTKISTRAKPAKPVTKTMMIFYKIFEDEAKSDLKKFDRAIHFLRENPENRRALLEAKQTCKMLIASAQMFGFDEISQLLSSIENILTCIQSREITITHKIIDSIILGMEMVQDLLENRSDGRGETGYIVDRLRELKEEQLESTIKPDNPSPHF